MVKTEEINEDILNLVMLGSSLPLAYYGAKLKEKLIFLIGFLLAGYGVYLFATENDDWLDDKIGIKVDTNIVLAVSIIVGLIVGCCFVWTYKRAVFTLGALVGILGSNLAFTFIAFDSFTPSEYGTPIKIVFVIICALISGYLFMKAEKQIMKLVTAIIGGFLFGASVAYFTQRFQGDEDKDVVVSVRKFFEAEDTSIEHCNWVCSVALLGWAFVTLTGIMYQYKMCGVGSSDDDEYQRKDEEWGQKSRYNSDNGFRSARGDRNRRRPRVGITTV